MEIYINTYGTYLHVSDQMFSIKVPNKETTGGKPTVSKVAAHKIKSVIITTQAAISTEFVKLALSNNIDIIFLEGNGKPLGRIWHSKLGSTTKIRKLQLQASLNEIGLHWTKQWLEQKLQNQIDFIKDLKKHRAEKHGDYLADKIERITNMQTKIKEASATTTDEIAASFRGWEGTAGRLYFETLSHVLPKQYQFNGRSSRPAQDPFNAFLNYAYGITYSKVEKALIIAGLDPYVGFMHRDDYNQKSMVFDYIEAYRYFAERIVFKLFSAKKINKAHTDEITNGYSLNKEGKVILVEAYNKFAAEDKIKYKGRNQTRLNVMQMDAHHFANDLLASEKEKKQAAADGSDKEPKTKKDDYIDEPLNF